MGLPVIFAGWSELLTKPVTSYAIDHDLGRVLHDLVTGHGIYDGVWEGFAFLALTVLIACLLLYLLARATAQLNDYVDNSRVDLSMLQTNIYISMEDVEMTTASINRRQLFHANAADVRAYHYSHTPEVGNVDHDSFSISTVLSGRGYTADTIVRRTAGGKGFEVTEVFAAALPTSIWATYLADRAVLNLFRSWKMFRHVIAERNVSFKSIGEYNQDNPLFQLQLMRYPAAEVNIWISFPAETAPALSDIKVMRLHENTADFETPIYVRREGRMVMSVSVLNARHERIRVEWANGKLHNYLQAQRSPALPPPLIS